MRPVVGGEHRGTELAHVAGEQHVRRAGVAQRLDDARRRAPPGRARCVRERWRDGIARRGRAREHRRVGVVGDDEHDRAVDPPGGAGVDHRLRGASLPGGEDRERSASRTRQHCTAIRARALTLRAQPDEHHRHPASAARRRLLADATRLGAVELEVTDLDRSIGFYTEVIGLTVHERERRHARPRRRRRGPRRAPRRTRRRARRAATPGLYHFALLFPTREELARAGRRIAESRTRSTAPPTTARTRRSTCPTPTGSASSSRPTARASSGPMRDGGGMFGHGPTPLDVPACSPRSRARRPARTRTPGCAWATSTSTSATSRRADALLPRRARLRGDGDDAHAVVRLRRAATTTTSPTTSGAASASAPAPAGRGRPAALDARRPRTRPSARRSRPGSKRSTAPVEERRRFPVRARPRRDRRARSLRPAAARIVASADRARWPSSAGVGREREEACSPARRCAATSAGERSITPAALVRRARGRARRRRARRGSADRRSGRGSAGCG